VSEIAKTSDAPKRTAAQIEADMSQTRERLVGTISQIEDRVKPANVAARGREKVEAFFRTDDGDIRWDHVGMVVGGTVAAIVGIRVTSRSVRWLFGEPRRKPTIVYVPTPVPAEVVAA
jgi:hypothetical protein